MKYLQLAPSQILGDMCQDLGSPAGFVPPGVVLWPSGFKHNRAQGPTALSGESFCTTGKHKTSEAQTVLKEAPERVLSVHYRGSLETHKSDRKSLVSLSPNYQGNFEILGQACTIPNLLLEG